mmetsp:Transcript_24829/g.52694  ORF Transcript_24829/g.52694 Transcript_24829/m.52694 type:complete len:521 (-) Transcript_24829:491-2053(-)
MEQGFAAQLGPELQLVGGGPGTTVVVVSVSAVVAKLRATRVPSRLLVDVLEAQLDAVSVRSRIVFDPQYHDANQLVHRYHVLWVFDPVRGQLAHVQEAPQIAVGNAIVVVVGVGVVVGVAIGIGIAIDPVVLPEPNKRSVRFDANHLAPNDQTGAEGLVRCRSVVRFVAFVVVVVVVDRVVRLRGLVHDPAVAMDDEMGTKLGDNLGNRVGIEPPHRNHHQIYRIERTTTTTTTTTTILREPQGPDRTRHRDAKGGDADANDKNVHRGPLGQSIDPQERRSAAGNGPPGGRDHPQQQRQNLFGVGPDAGNDQNQDRQFLPPGLPDVERGAGDGKGEEIVDPEGVPGKLQDDVDGGTQVQVAAQEQGDVSQDHHRHAVAHRCRQGGAGTQGGGHHRGIEPGVPGVVSRPRLPQPLEPLGSWMPRIDQPPQGLLVPAPDHAPHPYGNHRQEEDPRQGNAPPKNQIPVRILGGIRIVIVIVVVVGSSSSSIGIGIVTIAVVIGIVRGAVGAPGGGLAQHPIDR